MATFSPTPAPRRRYVAPGAARSPPPNPRRGHVSGSRANSRFATPAGYSRDDSVMEVDGASPSLELPGRGGTVFAKSEEFTATLYANLPLEVTQTLKNADFYRESYSGDIDTLTGFAIAASSQTCFVWQYAQALTGTPTCYIFACPLDTVYGSAPLHALVPSGTMREPGLLLLAPSGELRFWDSVADGLAGGTHFTSTRLPLVSDEVVTTFVRSDPQTYIASTSQGRLLRFMLSPSGGRQHLTSHVFSRPQSSLPLVRFLPALWNAGASVLPTDTETVNAVALGERSGDSREAWALLETRIQRWRIVDEGWEDLLFDEDVLNLCRAGVREAFPYAPLDDAGLGIELLDLAIVNSGKLVLLVSYAGPDDESVMEIGPLPRRIYAVIRLSYIAGSFKIDSVGAVPYQSTSSSGAPMHPRLKMISNGAMVSIQFGDAITFSARDSAYIDRVELKSATDRTLGVGVSEAGDLLLLTSATMIKTTINMEKIAAFNPETGRAKLIKSIMTQAILYGSNLQNPLHFSFPPEVDEDSLMAGAEQLSQAVLQSDVGLVKPNHDLSAHMAARKERLSFLINFINENGALGKISQRARQNLATDAEKLYAAHQLWTKHSENLVAETSVLNEAIYTYMSEASDDQHEDFVRAFFRLHVNNLEGLLPYIMAIVERTTYELAQRHADAVPEASSIVLTIFQSARRYREHNRGVYGVEPPMIKGWTSRRNALNCINELFDETGKVIEAPADLDTADRRAKDLPMRQLPELASLLFETMQERLEWVKSPLAAETSAMAKEADNFEDQFTETRPHVLDILRKNGHLDHAFALSEKYRDFRNLAALCNQEPVWPPQKSVHAERIEMYIDRFKDAFTTELYRWYIEHGELRTMFAQEDTQGAYIAKFFASHPNEKLSWIHALGNKQYYTTELALLRKSVEARELVEKHFMLSVGKLCILAQAHEEDGDVSSKQSDLDMFHDQLDFVSVHEKLLDNLKSVLNPKQKPSLDAQLDVIVHEKAGDLRSQKAFLTVFRMQVRRLLKGKALSVEDAVDVLTLKDNAADTDREDFVIALHLLARAADLVPGARAVVALRSVWRRIYTRDDWDAIRQTANVTDMELNERFRRTALYTVFQAASQDAGVVNFKLLTPADALVVPTTREIESRWPGMAPEQVEALEMDHLAECEKLAGLKLEDVIDRVKELATQDPIWT